ncbi:hypothetical protein DFH07DRAFT_976965 [Mycena maculata]|uniref:Uncharacterized protein n=1 Tax=Mycena maculata TaxID=230809 RepID=A0AAD7IP36_9AGAR|nr:hypothetical protein DFH07DRAFT_976965 [Mycena maculata]
MSVVIDSRIFPDVLATCPPRDNAGGALIEATPEPSGKFLDCIYLNAGLCTYFATDRGFSSGSSVCPAEAIAGSSTSSSNYTSSPAQCSATDDAGSALQRSNVTSDGFVACDYPAAGDCVYFSRGGQFSSGSSTCPDSITPGSSSYTNTGSPLGSGLAQCSSTDDAGSPLLSTGVTSDGFVSCDYQAAGDCVYFSPGGQFSSGSSTCPDSITPSSSSSFTDSKGSTSKYVANSPLCGTGFLIWSAAQLFPGPVTAGDCEYFSPIGEFSSGSSTCPKSIIRASNSPASGSVGQDLASFVAGSNDTGSNGNGSIPQPVVIALLAMNGVLVLGVLILGSLWVRDNRQNTKYGYLKELYMSPYRETSVPLTQGSSQGTYYDDHEIKPTGRYGYDSTVFGSIGILHTNSDSALRGQLRTPMGTRGSRARCVLHLPSNSPHRLDDHVGLLCLSTSPRPLE